MSNNHFRRLTITLNCLLIIITLSCQSQLPEKWTRDMELVTYNGGGMVAESKTVIIKDSSCSYIHWLPAKTDSLHFVLSQQELNDLLKKLNEFHFTGMSSSQAGGTVNDKPTTSIRFTRTEKTRKVSDSATERIKTGSESDFFKLFNYIGSLAENKTAANN